MPLVCVLLVERTPCFVLAGEARTASSIYGEEILVGGIGALNYESAVKMRGDGIEGVVQSNEKQSLLLRTLFGLVQSETDL